jgi:hypothetical protein
MEDNLPRETSHLVSSLHILTQSNITIKSAATSKVDEIEVDYLYVVHVGYTV